MRPGQVRGLIRTETADTLARAVGAWFEYRRFQCGADYDAIVAEVKVMRPKLDDAAIDDLLRRAEELEKG